MADAFTGCMNLAGSGSMTLFGVVRVILGTIGALMSLGFIGFLRPLLDGAWSAALAILLNAVIGLWLVRVAINGTFSGEPRKPVAAVENGEP
jgi:hypothetical protein